MNPSHRTIIEEIAGMTIQRITPLHGGMIGQVYRVQLTDDRLLVAKVADSGATTLDIEGYMLRYLAEHSDLPVPEVLHDAPNLLVMTFIEGHSHLDSAVQQHAADLLAALHDVRADQFGLERDTLIGGLHQPNTSTDSWIAFFREYRLHYMARMAHESGRLSSNLRQRIETFSNRLESLIDEPAHPALIHGDMWTTNILAHQGRVTGFVDPAIYYAHPEIELAFSTLFGTFGDDFFNRYQEHHPLTPGFFEERCDIYNLYPLLVHVRLFGGGYAPQVDAILRRFGA